MLVTYIKSILEIARQGDATEESYYTALKDFLIEYATSSDKQDVHVTILPKKTEAGNPDFRVWDGRQKIIGYIEAKTPDANLDQIEGTEQITRSIDRVADRSQGTLVKGILPLEFTATHMAAL